VKADVVTATGIRAVSERPDRRPPGSGGTPQEGHMKDGTHGSEHDHPHDDEHDGDSPEEPEGHECECSSTRKARAWMLRLQLHSGPPRGDGLVGTRHRGLEPLLIPRVVLRARRR
jgi:hypothetical protein